MKGYRGYVFFVNDNDDSQLWNEIELNIWRKTAFCIPTSTFEEIIEEGVERRAGAEYKELERKPSNEKEKAEVSFKVEDLEW